MNFGAGIAVGIAIGMWLAFALIWMTDRGWLP